MSSGTEADAPLWAKKKNTKEHGKMLKIIPSQLKERSQTGMLKDEKWKEKEGV